MGTRFGPCGPELTPAQYIDARMEELVDVLCQLSQFDTYFITQSPMCQMRSLRDIFASVFPIVTFLIDNAFELDRDVAWRESATELFEDLSSGVIGADNPYGKHSKDVLKRHSEEIAFEIVERFTEISTETINRVYTTTPIKNGEGIPRKVSKELEALMKKSACLNLYIHDPRKRIYLHGEFLKPFHTRLKTDGNGERRIVVNGWNYDNVASFGYSLMGALSRRENMERIERILLELSQYNIQPVLQCLYSQLGEVVDNIEKILKEIIIQPESMHSGDRRNVAPSVFPFTSAIGRWYKHKSELQELQGGRVIESGNLIPVRIRNIEVEEPTLMRPNPFAIGGPNAEELESGVYFRRIFFQTQGHDLPSARLGANSLELSIMRDQLSIGTSQSLN